MKLYLFSAGGSNWWQNFELRPRDLDLRPFDLGMGLRVTRIMGFPPDIFQVATPFRSRLRVRHWTDKQTDRQTTVIIVYCLHPMVA